MPNNRHIMLFVPICWYCLNYVKWLKIVRKKSSIYENHLFYFIVSTSYVEYVLVKYKFRYLLLSMKTIILHCIAYDTFFFLKILLW